MSDPLSSPALRVAFGPFEADLRTRELRKHGLRLRLPGMPFEVLAALIERPGDLVTREELRRRLWPDDTFVDFDNNLNSAVARLRQVLGDSADNPTYVETLPRLGYRFLGTIRAPQASALISSPPADTSAVTAAVSTAAGEEEADSALNAAASLRRPSTRVMTAVIGAVLVSAIGAWAWFNAYRAAPTARVMLLVLPFENLTGDEAQEYVGDGLTEEIITELARLAPERIGVIARTTSFRYKGRDLSVTEIAQAVGVDYVVEGSVRGNSDRVRVTAQLIESNGQTHVWAESYDRALVDMLAVERDIATAVAASVHVALAPAPTVRARSRDVPPQARDAYLRARHHAGQATVPAITQAIDWYTRAIEIDPSYALAHAGLARVLIFATRMEPGLALDRARASAERALTLDPELPEARLAWAMTRLYTDRDLAGATAEFQRVLAVDPGNADAHFYFSQALTAAGRFDDALRHARIALERDPFSPLVHHYVGRILLFAGRPADAAAHLRQTLDLEPNYGWALLFLALALEDQEDFAGAVAARQQYWSVMGVTPNRVTRLGDLYRERGYAEVRREWIAWIEGFVEQGGYVTSSELALLHAALGETDPALRWLERAFQDRTRDLIYVRVYRELAPYARSDPRFATLIDRILPPPG